MTIIDSRLNEIDNLVLARGAHSTIDDGACLLEAVAYIAGEPWSDHPQCVDPVLGAFGRTWNDALDNETRNRILKPFIPRLVGTRSTPDVQDTRAFMAADWIVRTNTPAWLRLAGLNDEAAALEALPVISSTELCRAAMPTIEAARKRAADAGAAAWDAARAAARDAAARAAARAVAGAVAGGAAGGAAGGKRAADAGDAAWDAAARAAARDAAARAAARDAAARAAARDAAGGAARAAAWDAARAAARDALAPTVELLQVSAADLFTRMIEVGP